MATTYEVFIGLNNVWTPAQLVVPESTALSLFTIQSYETTAVGTWSSGTDEVYSNTSGAAREFTFTGTSLKVYATKASHHGIARLVVNGVGHLVDLYSSTRNENVLVYSLDLTGGTHVIRWEWTGTKNAASTGTTVTFGSSVVASTVGDPYPDSLSHVAFDEQFNGTYTVTTTVGSHPRLVVEPGKSSQSISAGQLRINTGTTEFHRLYFYEGRRGGPGKPLTIRYRAKVETFYQGTYNGTLAGTQFWYKVPGDGYDKDDWTKAISGAGLSPAPSSMIMRGGLNHTGHMELTSFNGVTGLYEPFQSGKKVAYTPGTWVEGVVKMEHLEADTWRYRLWHTTDTSTVPVYDTTRNDCFHMNEPGWLAIRTDFCDVYYDYIKVEEGNADLPSDTLWSSDFSVANPLSTLNYEVSDSITNVSFGSLGGKSNALLVQMHTGVRNGAKWRSRFHEASGAPAGKSLGILPEDEAWFSYKCYLPSDFDFGIDCKIPGLAGLPDTSTGWHTSAGGVDQTDAWSARVHTRRAGGFGQPNPYFDAYLYAQSAAGKSITSEPYGIYIRASEGLNGAGTALPVPVAQWFTVEMRVKMQSAVSASDGEYELWINGVRGVSLADVQWTSTGPNPPKINQWMAETFYNSPGPTTVNHKVGLIDFEISLDRPSGRNAIVTTAPVLTVTHQ